MLPGISHIVLFHTQVNKGWASLFIFFQVISFQIEEDNKTNADFTPVLRKTGTLCD